MTTSAALQKQLYGIGIFEEEIVLADFTGAEEKRFVVSPDQLMAFVRTEVTFRPFPGLVWMKSDAQNDSYLLVLPAGRRTIIYRKGKKLTEMPLTLPPIAVQVRIGQTPRTIQSISMWGMAGKELQPETVLYELPLPNLSGASLCLGSTERAIESDLRDAVERTIFDTPFNHHNNVCGREKLTFHDYVKKHKGTCPLRSLNKIGTGRKILGGLI
jgi:hypothetical protein